MAEAGGPALDEEAGRQPQLLQEEEAGGGSDQAPLLTPVSASTVSAASIQQQQSQPQQHRRRRPWGLGEEGVGGGSSDGGGRVGNAGALLAYPRSFSPASSRLSFTAVSRTGTAAAAASSLSSSSSPSSSCSSPSDGSSRGNGRGSFGPGEWLALQSGYWQPRGYVKECTPPPPVAAAFARDEGAVRGLRVFFAANLKDNGPLIRHFTTRLLETVALFPPGHVFVSIHESNSRDETPLALLELRRQLETMGVPHRIEVGAADTKLPGEDRIDFLVRMRNEALAPLFSSTPKEQPFDRVVFLNDVYFCPWHILRLLGHTLEGGGGTAATAAHFACGLDFKTPSNRDIWWRKLRGLYTGPRFYDIWVARDARGQRFVEDPPFVLQASPSSSSAAASAVHGTESSLEGEKGIKGLSALPLAPFPVYCCWNGLAVLHTAPLYCGVRFRASRPGKTTQSECSFICDDYWASGYGHVLVDPLVRLAYDARTDLDLQGRDDLTALPPIAAPPPPTPFPPHAPPTIDACYLDPGPNKKNKRVDYSQCSVRPPLDGAIGVDRLCCSPEEKGVVVVVLPSQGDEIEMKARLRSWQELHPFPQWRVEIVTEAGARARVLQSSSQGAVPSGLMALLRDGGRWEERRGEEGEGARVVVAVALLLAMRGEGCVGVVGRVDGGEEEGGAVMMQRSVGCMLQEGTQAAGGVRVVEGDGEGLRREPMVSLEGSRGVSFVVSDDASWAQMRGWVEDWARGGQGNRDR